MAIHCQMAADPYRCDLEEQEFERLKRRLTLVDYLQSSPEEIANKLWQQAEREVTLRLAREGKTAKEICLEQKKQMDAYEEKVRQANEKWLDHQIKMAEQRDAAAKRIAVQDHQIKMAEQRDAAAQRIASGDTKSKRRRERRRKK